MLSVLTLTTAMLFALVLSFYGNYELRAFTAWPIVVSVISVMIFVTFLKGTLSKRLIKTILISSLWIFYQLLMTFNYINVELHIKAILEALQYIIFFSVLFSVNGESKSSIFYFFRLSVIFFILISMLSLLLYLFSGSVWAFTGFHSNPNTYAVTCLFLCSICIFFHGEIFNSKLENIVIVFFLVLLLVITGSSKGFVGIVFVFIMYVLFTQKIVHLTKYLIVFLLASIIFIPFADKSISRLSDKFISLTTFDSSVVDSKSIGNDSGKIRLYLMINAFEISMKYPLTGVGVNNGQLYLPLPDSFSRSMDTINSQNNLTEMLLNGGVPAFILYYFPLIFLLYKSLIRKNKSNVDYFIISSVLLKIFIDSGMKSYNDSNHVMFYCLIVFLFYSDKFKAKI